MLPFVNFYIKVKKGVHFMKNLKKNNPIIPRKGVCDPHIHIFQDRAYLYASHDFSIDNKDWIMEDWQIWSSGNLVDWDYETTVNPSDTYMGKANKCWATDAAFKNGRYYFYFSNANIDTGVLVSDNPAGPFTDPLGKPLLPEDLTPTLSLGVSIDHTVSMTVPFLGGLLWMYAGYPAVFGAAACIAICYLFAASFIRDAKTTQSATEDAVAV
jgi:hypothetical protein